MVGRAYTMKEMKQIVDYLVEHRAYNEVRGRKMWMDLAGAKIVDRTWQSLKETFLKRILLDIHNPYYKLTVEQIASFRQECDISAKNKNRLEIQTISDDSSSNNHQAIQDINGEVEKTGEDKCSKIQNRTRSSTDTLVLENCYENAEEIERELESPTKSVTSQKSIRDFITYSEPLTPMLQEVLHDFSSDDEPQMQIVDEPETSPTVESNAKKSRSPETIRESQSYTKKTDDITNNEDSTTNKTQPSKVKSLKLKKTQKGTWENKDVEIDGKSPQKDKETNNNCSDTTSGENNTDSKDPKTKNVEKSITDKNNSNNITNDTPLPNNQEELGSKLGKNRTSTESSNSEFLDPLKKKKEKSRKRSHSQSSVEKKKKKKNTQLEPSESREPENDTATFNSHPQATSLQKNLPSTEVTQEKTNPQIDSTDDTNISPNVLVDDSNRKGNEVSHEAEPSDINAADINPCLKSVSLYEEQFSQLKYFDTDEELVSKDKEFEINNIQEKNKQPDYMTKNVCNNESIDDNISKQGSPIKNNKEATTSKALDLDGLPSNSHSENSHEEVQPSSSILVSRECQDVVLLKSHSENSSELSETSPNNPNRRRNKTREKVLANLFGFASGGGVSYKGSNNSKSSSRRYKQHHRMNSRTYDVNSGSSDDYTTVSEDDIPHNRKNGPSRKYSKYTKPLAYDILSHENSLFVVGRNKLYPLIMREHGSLHYACAPESKYSEQTDSYWKAKYLEESKKLAEEKIRADELSRLLQKANKNKKARETNSPDHQNGHSSTVLCRRESEKETEVTEPANKPDKNIKIKFNKNKEVELEGQWTNINPILERMVELFKTTEDEEVAKAKTPDAGVGRNAAKKLTIPLANKNSKQTRNKPKIEQPITIRDSDKDEGNKKDEESVVVSSEKSTPTVITPTDSETHKRIDIMEKTIFEKIAELDKTDQNIEMKNDLQERTSDSNVTKRKRGRPGKVRTPSVTSNKEIASQKAGKIKRALSLGPEHYKSTLNKPGPSKRASVPQKRYGRGGIQTRTMSLGPEAHIQQEIDSDTSPKRPIRESRSSAKKIRTLLLGPESCKPPAELEMESSKQATEAPKGKKKTASVDSKKRKSIAKELASETDLPKRPSRAPKKFGSESNLAFGTKRPKSRSKASGSKPVEDEVSIPEDDNVRYKLSGKALTPSKSNKTSRKYAIYGPTITSPDHAKYSETTTYQDSDVTPPNITKRKRKVSLVCKKGLNKKVRRKSSPYLADDDSCSTNDAQIQKSCSHMSNSSVYRSDSYQMLMPKNKQHNFQLLSKIDENPLAQKIEINANCLRNNNTLATNINEHDALSEELRINSSGLKGSEANSSTVSLPLSPEISVVENISISKDVVNSGYRDPPINETQTNHIEVPTSSFTKYLISDVDVSMPLMAQDFKLKSRINTKPRNRRATSSEILPQEQHASESLNQKLKDLLLESAKKIAQRQTETNVTDSVMDVDIVTSEKKAKGRRRRSSTPRKKIPAKRSKTVFVEPVVEEHIETCSQSGRKSCPPVIHIIACEDAPVNIEPKTKPDRSRKKKDIIKVKILRPRSNSGSKDRGYSSKLSVCSDSGINKTESASSEGCQCCDVSTELIHNHSDTCLYMDDCVGDSVELVEDADNLIISINSTSLPSEIQDGKSNNSNEKSDEFLTPELFCCNAQHADNLTCDARAPVARDSDDVATIYQTPSSCNSFNSLITDDLSVELADENKPPSRNKWYLLSEDETNTNFDPLLQTKSSVGANLDKIFISCAVPDLSTISERSKENDTKTVVNTDYETDTISQSLFDLEF